MNTPHPYLFVAVITALVLFGFFSMFRLSAHAGFVHKGLNDIHERAKKATTHCDLTALRAELCVFHDKYCFHRILGDHAREVMAYIDGRLRTAV